MSMINPAAAYRNQQIMMASPEQLTLMLYDGAIRFLRASITAIDAKDIEKAHDMNMRTQDIVREFRNTLNMDIELSANWDQLYEFMEYRLVEGNMKKDKAMLQEVLDLLKEMRDTWAEAMKLAKGIPAEK
ncbi:MAG: flagellar export chaperone FliS [Anaeromusa sp.]|uniref:flagellar export chaperone FliS n=1 Tax=Anaeromusa sp. TaxID=1872520 RepID=UPI002B201E61|nr:flagellar export chaperone FliS [Anaeromusa sp.]MEA4835979.1 flagellar export chaperone FliS [Anaeromusa sp.]